MMDHNPYSPPQTEVREAPADDTGARPRQVTLAVRLFWAELAVGVVQYATTLKSTGTEDAGPAIVAFTLVFIGALFIAEAIVIYKLWMRRNWARYVALVSTVLSLLGVVQSMNRGRLTIAAGEMGFSVLELMLDAVALVLLFTSPGKEWFKKRKAG
jgi:uncharacterized membrane protein (DUF2068 family)